jgi:hypothetical protein
MVPPEAMNWEAAWEKAMRHYHQVCVVSTEVLEAKKAEMTLETVEETVQEILFYMQRSRYAGQRWREAAELTLGLRGSKRRFLN